MLLLQNSYLVSSDNNQVSDHERNFWFQRQAATRPIDIQMDMLEKSLHGVDAAADILPHAAYIAGLAHNQLFMPSDMSQRTSWAGACGLDNSNKHYYLSHSDQASFMRVMDRKVPQSMISPFGSLPPLASIMPSSIPTIASNIAFNTKGLPESPDTSSFHNKYPGQSVKQEKNKTKDSAGSESSEHEESIVQNDQASSDDALKAIVASAGKRRRRNATDDVTIFPRRKAGQDKLGRNRPPIVISLPMLQRLFDLPQRAASKKLGICTTVMKKVCRRLGVCKWPYKESKARKLSSAAASSD